MVKLPVCVNTRGNFRPLLSMSSGAVFLLCRVNGAKPVRVERYFLLGRQLL